MAPFFVCGFRVAEPVQPRVVVCDRLDVPTALRASMREKPAREAAPSPLHGIASRIGKRLFVCPAEFV